MRLKYLGAVPIVFAHDGLPEWQPGAELDVADALGAKLLSENPNTLAEVKPEPEAEPAKAEAPTSRGKSKSDDAAVAAESEA